MIPFLPLFEIKKVWGFPSLEINKFGGFTKFMSHVFDRYEIHVQAFVDFINGKSIIFRSSSPQNYFKKYILKQYISIKNKIQTIVHILSITFELLDSRICKNNILRCPHILSNMF